jgi:hypothetical protein
MVFLAGQVLTAGALNAAFGVETDYSSSLTITASTTNPTKGDSVYSATYRQMGKLVYYAVGITIGSTWAAGSGTYRFSLPVTAAGLARNVGSVWVNESGVALRVGSCKLQSATNAEVYLSNLTGAALGSSGPSAAGWSTNDGVLFELWYEAV